MFGRSRNIDSRELFAVANDTERFSILNLRRLHQQLEANKCVTKENENVVIEILRLSSEMVVYGDNNSELLFDFFCEKNMMSLFLEIMWTEGGCPLKVHIQILQTLSILVGCVRNDTSLYYLLSNNYINEIIIFPHEFEHDDCESEALRDQYISFLKSLSLKLNCLTVQFFFIEKTGAFPLLSKAIDLLAVEEPMVRAGAQTVVLNVLRVKDARAREYALQDEVVLKLFSQIVNIMETQYMAIHTLLLRYNEISTNLATGWSPSSADKSDSCTGRNYSGKKNDSGARRGSFSIITAAADTESLLASPPFQRKANSSCNREDDKLQAQLRQQLERTEGQIADLLMSAEDWLMYLQDLLGLKIMRLRRTLVHHLVTEFIYPVLLEPFLRPAIWTDDDSNSEDASDLEPLASSSFYTATATEQSDKGNDYAVRQKKKNTDTGTWESSTTTGTVIADNGEGIGSRSQSSPSSSSLPTAAELFPSSPSSSSVLTGVSQQKSVVSTSQGVSRTPVTETTSRLVYLMAPPSQQQQQQHHGEAGKQVITGCGMKGDVNINSSSNSSSSSSISGTPSGITGGGTDSYPSTPIAAKKSKEQLKLEREEAQTSVVVSLTYLSKFLRVISDKMVVRAVFMAMLHPLSRKGRKKVLHEIMTGSTGSLVAFTGGGGGLTSESEQVVQSEYESVSAVLPLMPSAGAGAAIDTTTPYTTTAPAPAPAASEKEKEAHSSSTAAATAAGAAAAAAEEVLLSLFLTEYSNPYRSGFLQLFSSGNAHFSLLGTMVLHSLSRGLLLSLENKPPSPVSTPRRAGAENLKSSSPRDSWDRSVSSAGTGAEHMKFDPIWRETTGECTGNINNELQEEEEQDVNSSPASFYSANEGSSALMTPVHHSHQERGTEEAAGAAMEEEAIGESLLCSLPSVNSLVALQAAGLWPDGFTPMSISEFMTCTRDLLSSATGTRPPTTGTASGATGGGIADVDSRQQEHKIPNKSRSSRVVTGRNSAATGKQSSSGKQSGGGTGKGGFNDDGNDNDFEADDIESLEAEHGLYALEPDVMSVFKLVAIDAFVRKIVTKAPKCRDNDSHQADKAAAGISVSPRKQETDAAVSVSVSVVPVVVADDGSVYNHQDGVTDTTHTPNSNDTGTNISSSAATDNDQVAAAADSSTATDNDEEISPLKLQLSMPDDHQTVISDSSVELPTPSESQSHNTSSNSDGGCIDDKTKTKGDNYTLGDDPSAISLGSRSVSSVTVTATAASVTAAITIAAAAASATNAYNILGGGDTRSNSTVAEDKQQHFQQEDGSEQFYHAKEKISIYDDVMMWPSMISLLIDMLADTSSTRHSKKTTVLLQMAAHTVYTFARIAHTAASELDDAYTARLLQLPLSGHRQERTRGGGGGGIALPQEANRVTYLKADDETSGTEKNEAITASPFRSSLIWCSEAVHEAFLKSAAALLDRLNGSGGDDKLHRHHAETRVHSEIILDILQEELLRLPSAGVGSKTKWRDVSDKMNGNVLLLLPLSSSPSAVGIGSLRADLEHFVPTSQSEVCRMEVQRFLLLRCLDLQLKKLASDATLPTDSIEEFNMTSIDDPVLDSFLPTIISPFPAGTPFDMRGKRFLDAYPAQDVLSSSSSSSSSTGAGRDAVGLRSPSPNSFSSSLLSASFLTFNLFGSGSSSSSGGGGGGGLGGEDTASGVSVYGGSIMPTVSGRTVDGNGKRRLKLSVLPAVVPAIERSPSRGSSGGGVADVHPVTVPPSATAAVTPALRGPRHLNNNNNNGSTRGSGSNSSSSAGLVGGASVVEGSPPSTMMGFGIPPKVVVKSSRSKKYGDVLFVQDENYLIIAAPNRMKGAASGFNVWISAPLIYTDCAIVSTDRRELRIFVRSWDTEAHNMDPLLLLHTHNHNDHDSAGDPSSSSPYNYNYNNEELSANNDHQHHHRHPIGISMSIPSATVPGDNDRIRGATRLPSFLRPRHEVQGGLWQTYIAFESERSCTLAAQHIENSRLKALHERVLRLKGVLSGYIAAGENSSSNSNTST